MLKWLSNARPRSHADLVTDDPLATISVLPKEAQADVIYSVSRLNPLFEDDGYTKVKKRWHEYLKESSSGYESKNSSDHTNSRFEGDRVFQKEAVSTLEQNSSFVKSILVAVRGKKESTTLNPIPEDSIKIDYTIPRPVWPRHEKYKKQHSYKNEKQSNDWHSENERSDTSRRDNFIIRPKVAAYEETADSAKDILKDLAHTIKLAIDQKTQLSPEDLLRTLSDSMNKNWDRVSSDSALRQISRNLNQSEVATISRAFSHTSSFSEHCNRPLSDAEAGRLSLLQRLGKLSLYEPPAYEKHVRESSTSSEETSSGFSEFSPTPTTSSSSADSPSSRRSPENTKVPLFTHENLSTVSNGLRNAVLYGSGMQCRDGQNEYEKLNFRDRKSSNEEKSEDSLQDLSLSNWDDPNLSKQHDAQYQSSNLTIPGFNFPDFTLDTHQAEKLMHKIQATKRQRCWCRMATCLFGLLFLLLSVMAVSMFLTRGQRMFGSL